MKRNTKRNAKQPKRNPANDLDLGIITVADLIGMVDKPEPERTAWRNTEDVIRFAERVTTGDPETLSAFMRNRPAPALATPTECASAGYGVCGDYVDVGRFVTGEPECMVHYDELRAQKFLTVNVTLGRPGLTPDYNVQRYYGVFLDVIDQLERNGTRCRVVIQEDTFLTRHSAFLGGISRYRLVLKEHDQPLNMAQFAGFLLNNETMKLFYRYNPNRFGFGRNDDLRPGRSFKRTTPIHSHPCTFKASGTGAPTGAPTSSG